MERKLSRQDFVKLSGAAAGSVLSGGLLCSCTTSQMNLLPIKGPIHYARLSANKIQSPENFGLTGCYTGIWMGNYACVGQHKQIDSYEEMVGKKPTIFKIPYRAQPAFTGTQVDAAIYERNRNYQMLEEVARKGVIPFITYDMRIGESQKSGHEMVIQGKFDKEISVTAQWLKRFGESYNGFFIRTMREMNLRVWPWSKNTKKFKKAWQHIWQIFDAEGANLYATWVFNPYVNSKGDGIGTQYYPGDQYVDWIGFNGYNFDGQGSWAERQSITSIFSFASNKYYRIHKTKPQMICETGMDRLAYKHEWVKRGLTSMKKNLPAIKGVFFITEIGATIKLKTLIHALTLHLKHWLLIENRSQTHIL